MPAASNLQVGVVGLGYWGPNLARNVDGLDCADLRWLCDARPDVLASVARRYPAAAATTDFDDLLRDPELDAVAIATPVGTHARLAEAALDAGKHVFVEKPLAASSAESVRLAGLADARGLVLMPGHTFLYSPPVVKVKELIDSGELGEIYFISTSRVNLGLHQPDVSVVWDLGPHDISILRYWLDELPSRVSALARGCILPNTPDVAFIDMTFPSGTVAHVELSWLAPSKLRRTAVVGSQKMVVYDDTSAEPVRVYDSGALLPDPEGFGEYRLSYRTGDIVSPRIDAAEPLALELADFCAAVRGAGPPRSSAEVGIDVIRTIEAVDRSLAAGGTPIEVDSAGSDELSDVLADALRPRVERPVERPSAADGIGTAVLGAGPAGLTAALVLAQRGEKAAVFEADGTVGGIAKTVDVDGYRFDLGGHRFFTKLAPIARLWEDVLGDEFLLRPRQSRIFTGGKFFSYPLTASDVLSRVGIWEAGLCVGSYLWKKVSHRGSEPDTFEAWVTSRFGRRLYETFFRSYTEKVWGIPGSEIQSLWAAQRIRDFSLWKAMLRVLGVRQDVTTLIEQFHYPRRGPGQMWEAFQARIEERGVAVHLRSRVVGIRHANGRVTRVAVRRNGDVDEYPVDGVLSSLALSDLVRSLDPAPPDEVLEAAERLRYRDLCLVALMTTEEEPFPDNWVYLHDPDVRAGRVQNYRAWSEEMVRPGTTCLGVEYFCFEGDEIWEMPSEEIVALATKELASIGLIDASKVFDGVKVLVPKAYPMYDRGFDDAVRTIRSYLESFENLYTFGRNGLHRYNNQDHSMWTATLATLNHLDGAGYDVWAVNTEATYQEEGQAVESAIAGPFPGSAADEVESGASAA